MTLLPEATCDAAIRWQTPICANVFRYTGSPAAITQHYLTYLASATRTTAAAHRGAAAARAPSPLSRVFDRRRLSCTGLSAALPFELT